MTTLSLVAKKDGYIQYIDKVLAKRSMDSKKFKIAGRNQKGNNLELQRTRRDVPYTMTPEEKSATCKNFQLTAAIAGGAGNVASAASSASASLSFLGAPAAAASAGIAAGAYVAQTAADVEYINMDCSNIPFDEIKEIMDKRFNNIDKALDRNYAALQEISKIASKTLTVVEQTRIEMHQGFNDVLVAIKASRIDPILSKLNSFNEYFDTEKDQINSLTKDQYTNRIDEINNVLKNLEDSGAPKGDSLYALVNDIIYQRFAIPRNADEIIGISALYALHYGTQTYASVLFFLIEQHSYIGDYYFENGNLEKFNEHFGKIQEIFQIFRSTLTNRNGLIDDVMNIITEVRGIDFIADDRVLAETLTDNLQELEILKDNILEMTLPVIQETPKKLKGQITFKPPYINTPIGDWTDRMYVYYAMQYKNGDKYSKVGPWSDPFIVQGKANPTLRIPTDRNRRTRLIYRKFNNLNPQLVGILEDEYQTEYRDIDRDLYNVAAWPNTDNAGVVFDILLQNGANSSAIFDQGRRALHSAAAGGNPMIAINKLKPTNFNIRDYNGFTPLHIAAEAGNDESVKILVQEGADINAQTFAEELTPMHLAALQGYDSIVRSLMGYQRIDMNLDNNEGFTPLHSAVAGGLRVVEAILSHPSVDVNRRSNRGLSALHLAAINDYMDIAEALLRTRKLNLNIEAEGQLTPLHFATIVGHMDMVQFLLTNGADINGKSVTKWTPLHFAVSLRKNDIASVLLQSSAIDFNPKTDDGSTPMHIACGSEQIEMVEKILKNRPPHIVREILNTKTKDGLTPLHIVIMKKYTNFVSLLLGKGADIEAKTNEGLTPLLAATASGNLVIVKILLRNNANMDVVDAKGRNILHLAAENGHLDILKHLVEDRGFSLKQDKSLIMSVIPKGHLNIIKYLVEDKGLDPKCFSVSLNSVGIDCPLTEASKYGNLDMFKYLESKQETIERIDYGRVLIRNVAEYGHLNLLKYIIEEKGADPNNTEIGLHAMAVAVANGWLSIVKYLHDTHRIALNLKHYPSMAASSGNLYLLKYLMESDAGSNSWEDPNVTKPLLSDAVHGPNRESLHDKLSSSVLRYLVDEKNYDVNFRDREGFTALLHAVQSGSFYVVKFLISRGADLHIGSRYGITPLSASNPGTREFLQMQDVCTEILKNNVPVINQDYNVNALCIDVTKGLTDDIYHTTALHLAAYAGAIETVNLLINRRANVNARDDEGNVPLHLAVQKENINMINLLVLKGADTTIKNLSNQSPKDLAKENHAMNIVDILKQAQTDRNSGHLRRVGRSIIQEASVDIESSSKAHDNVLTHIIQKVCGNNGATPLCLQSSSGNQGSIDVRGAECLNSNVSLGLLLAQNFLNKKFPLPNFSHVTTAEARAMAAAISNKFEKLLKKHTKNADDLDFYQLYKDIEGNIENEKFTNVPNLLHKFAEKACGKDVGAVADKIANTFHKF